MYLNGWGTGRDALQAYKWLKIALETARGEDADYRKHIQPEIDEATALLGRATQTMSPDEIAEAEKQAAEWIAKRDESR